LFLWLFLEPTTAQSADRLNWIEPACPRPRRLRSVRPTLGDGKRRISREGGAAPKWTSDGKQLIYGAGNGALAVDVRANGNVFETGNPRRLFQAPGSRSDFGWDMTGDGKHFLIASPVGASATESPITVLMNWPALLKKK